MLRVSNLRLLYIATLVALAVVSSMPLASQVAGHAAKSEVATLSINSPSNSGAHSGSGHVEKIQVRGAVDALEIEIQTSGGSVSPNTQVLTAPDRILIDFPGAFPAAVLRDLQVHRGPLKTVRAGLFFSNPPITRVVLDLAAPQAYQIMNTRVSATQSSFVIKIGSAKAGVGETAFKSGNQAPTSSTLVSTARVRTAKLTEGVLTSSSARGMAVPMPMARVQNAMVGGNRSVVSAASTTATANVVTAELATVSEAVLPSMPAAPVAPPPAKPALVVVFENGLLRIHADKSTMAEVLFEVQRQTQAEIAIPAGAEQEQVVIDIGPASSREVLGALFNGSAYNFIFMGSEEKLERVILTRREGGTF
jgi:AMIN domain